VGPRAQTVAGNLFGDSDPLGQVIRIKNVPFGVIGVLQRKGQTTFGQDQDDTVLIPLSTAKRKVLGSSQANARAVGSIAVKVGDARAMPDAEQEIRGLLRQRHRLQTFQEDDFGIRNLTEVLQSQGASSRVLTWLLAAIASVSLLVGGIGIMNIMLVSVTERTREIGLRMAVGARGGDILVQFLVEAVTLSSWGASWASRSVWAAPTPSPTSRSGAPWSASRRWRWRSSSRLRSGCSSASIRPGRPPASTRSTPCGTSDGRAVLKPRRVC